MVLLWLDTVFRDALLAPRSWGAIRAALFLSGFVFFGWFWTHGGQTLGMRVWRLQARRSDDAGPPTWSQAAARYAVAWISWLPLGAGVLWSVLDARHRTWQEIASRTETVVLPRATERS